MGSPTSGGVLMWENGMDHDLAASLRDPSPLVRTEALARCSSDVATVAPALQDAYPLVRREAIRALGRIGGDEAARAILNAAAHDPSVEVREEAVIVLAGILRSPQDATAGS